MAKRHASDGPGPASISKRARLAPERLSNLSDELLLRVLSNLPPYDLTVCQRVSRRLHTIAGDSQLWKAAYYDRFVLPRVSRLPKTKGKLVDSKTTPSKLPRWLDDDALVKRGTATNWKRQFRLRHKWSRGSCELKDVPVASRPAVPPLLARLQDGVVYTVDSNYGLRAWSYKDDQNLLCTKSLEIESTDQPFLPTAFAIDASTSNADVQRLAVGFENGAFSVFCYRKTAREFERLYTHPPSSNGLLYALAFTLPYLLTMTESQILSLYKFEESTEKSHGQALSPPRLLTSLKSHTVWPPLSLSLRTRASGILAAIAYSLPTYNAGWSAGVQELHLTSGGDILDSRLATAHSQGFCTLASSGAEANSESDQAEVHQAGSGSDQTTSRPTSLSYAHPYLLVSHSDNTLTLYMVTSSTTQLTVGPGRRLWGHTSSVFGAHVESRGKAVSVSTRGDEIRVWELERSNFAGPPGSGRTEQDLSVQVTPERRRQSSSSSRPSQASLKTMSQAMSQGRSELGLPPGVSQKDAVGNEGEEVEHEEQAMDVTRGWVGFDETNVIVLREQAHGRQALAVYDFS